MAALLSELYSPMKTGMVAKLGRQPGDRDGQTEGCDKSVQQMKLYASLNREYDSSYAEGEINTPHLPRG